MRQRAHIPTLIGIMFLSLTIAAGVLLIQNRNFFLSSAASPGITPRNVRVTNITDSSFAVSWITTQPTIGAILYGTQELNQTAYDDYDTDHATIHHITIRGLSAQTPYHFKIFSGGVLFGQEQNPWMQLTGPSLPPRAADIVAGSVKTVEGGKASFVLVYLTADNASSLSTVTNKEGRFVFSLSTLRTTDLLAYSPYDTKTALSLFVQTSLAQHDITQCCSSARVTVENATTLPSLVIGQVYDFRSTIPEGEFTSPQSRYDVIFPHTLPTPSSSNRVPAKRSLTDGGGSRFSIVPLEELNRTSPDAFPLGYPQQKLVAAVTTSVLAATAPPLLSSPFPRSEFYREDLTIILSLFILGIVFLFVGLVIIRTPAKAQRLR